ncbi:MAG: hypothetical protein WC326_02340 [Candidatus Delongbacteria bacterium]
MRKTLCGALVVALVLAVGCGSKPAEEPVPTPEPVVETPAPVTVDTMATAPATTDTTAAATH